jgi:hypothetical protein
VKILKETEIIRARVAEKETTIAQQTRIETIKTYYDQRIATISYHPSYSTFRMLPTVRTLAKSWTSSDITQELKSGTVLNLIGAELVQWIERAVQRTRQKLGYYDPSNKHGRGKKNASLAWQPTEGKLNPESRITSWFTCIKCKDVEPAYKKMMVMDFAGICVHECKEKHKSVRDRTPWDIGEPPSNPFTL